jgi:hypothetical protein
MSGISICAKVGIENIQIGVYPTLDERHALKPLKQNFIAALKKAGSPCNATNGGEIRVFSDEHRRRLMKLARLQESAETLAKMSVIRASSDATRAKLALKLFDHHMGSSQPLLQVVMPDETRKAEDWRGQCRKAKIPGDAAKNELQPERREVHARVHRCWTIGIKASYQTQSCRTTGGVMRDDLGMRFVRVLIEYAPGNRWPAAIKVWAASTPARCSGAAQQAHRKMTMRSMARFTLNVRPLTRCLKCSVHRTILQLHARNLNAGVWSSPGRWLTRGRAIILMEACNSLITPFSAENECLTTAVKNLLFFVVGTRLLKPTQVTRLFYACSIGLNYAAMCQLPDCLHGTH